MKTDNNTPHSRSDEKFKLYELLWHTLPFYHARWIDNYRIFLSFNAFLLPAVTALMGYAIREDSSSLRPFVCLLCAIGALATWQGLRLLKRIRVDTDLRFNQLLRVEDEMSTLPIHPFREGKTFFFENGDLPDLHQSDYRDKGIRAIDAYHATSVAIISYYVAVGLYSVWPWISRSIELLVILMRFKGVRRVVG